MVKRYLGGVISATPPTVSSSGASGIFSLAAAAQYRQSNNWQLYIPTVTITVNATPYSVGASTKSFTTNGYYTLTVAQTCTLLVQMWGAGGGTGSTNAQGQGGAGGYVEGKIQFIQGTTYVFLIGQGGASVSTTTMFPDGGAGTSVAGCGGGSTRLGPYTQSGFNLTNTATDYNNTNAVYYLIAAGGGGSANWVNSGSTPNTGTYGGYGGGLVGAAGGAYYSADTATSPGGGATQSAGGTAGTGGRLGSGAAGAKYAGGPTSFLSTSSGGGGGGYYGGGSAAGYYSNGGGGSGFINSTFVTSGLFYTASTGNNNYISPDPRTNKPTTTGNGAGGSTNAINTGSDGGIIFSMVSIP